MKKTHLGPRRLVLASASPRRKALLQACGLPLRVVQTDVRETPLPGEGPLRFVRRMAKEKAKNVSVRFPRHWVLGADTVVVLGGNILGKPRDEKEAERFLRLLSGKTHRVITAYCLVKEDEAFRLCRSVTTRVSFKTLRGEEIAWYVRSGEPLDKAGAYAVQGKGGFCVRRIHGSYTNVVGLPVAEVLEDLERYAGFRLE